MRKTAPFTVACNVCYELKTVTVTAEGWRAWRREGKFIQDAMPELTPAERELLLSGTCGDCFDAMFPVDDEEENESES